MEALIGFNSIHTVLQTVLLLQLLSSAQRLVSTLRPEIRTVGHKTKDARPGSQRFSVLSGGTRYWPMGGRWP